MKFFNILFSILFIVQGFVSYGQTYFDPASDPNYSLVWEDDFSSLNYHKWQKKHDFDHYGDVLVYLNDRATVSQGTLKLVIDKLTTPYFSTNLNPWGCKRQWFYLQQTPPYNIGYDYAGGWLETVDAYDVPINTYIEVRAKMPHIVGLNPAFWLFGGHENNYEEIDVYENVGYTPSNVIGTNVHTGTKTGRVSDGQDVIMKDYSTNPPTILTYANTYHTYGVKWDVDYIYIYVNGYLQRTIQNRGMYNYKKIILDMSVTHYSTDPNHRIPLPDANGIIHYQADKMLPASYTTSTMEIDWIKVWDKTNTTTIYEKTVYA